MPRPIDAHQAQSLLQELERRLGSVDAQLLAAEPAGLERACAELRDGSFALADLMTLIGSPPSGSEAASGQALRKRLDALAQRLLDQRNSLARRSVVVDRTLDSILRPHGEVTYRIPGERGTFSRS